MYLHHVNYRRDVMPVGPGGPMVNVGFWAGGLPRIALICRLFGHKPVVDGTEPLSPRGSGTRWVCCDRCGVRPEPQGSLNPDNWTIGRRYWGSFPATYPNTPDGIQAAKLARYYNPGPFPRRMTGTLGGQLVIGRHGFGVGAEVKVGNGGSEHTLAANIKLGWLGALYLHTERFGTWLQRRLNPTGYHSRVIGLELSSGRLAWKLWAKRDEWSRTDPWWRRGEVDLRVLDKALGPKRYSYTDVPNSETITVVRMPEGDEQQVYLVLQRCTFGRRRGRKALSWHVDWDSKTGIPTKPEGRGLVFGSGMAITDQSTTDGTWATEASTAIAAYVHRMRARAGGWDTTSTNLRGDQ